MITFGRYIIYFLIYSFLGAVGETIFRLLTEHQLYGIHGFLHLPIMPIYGIGAILVILLLGKRHRHPVWLFVVGTLLASLLEFIVHWLIEVTFNIRIWDYSHKPFNLDGRIALVNSLAFGVATVILVYLIHPFISSKVQKLKPRTIAIAASIIGIVVATDTVLSVTKYLGLW
jgi:uncharacterized membrane protein